MQGSVKRKVISLLKYNVSDLSLRELQSSINAIKENRSFFKTDKNNFLDLTDIRVVGFLNLIDELKSGEELKEDIIKIDKSKALYLDSIIKNKSLNFIKGEEALNNIRECLIDRKHKNIKVPKNLNATLREYQIDGFKWFKTI